MWRKVLGAVVLLLLTLSEKAVAVQYAFQVSFTDKNNTPYSLSAPLAYLSPRAIARRAAQGISIDNTDLPVDPAYIDSVLTLTGGKMHEVSRWLNLCVILLSDSANIHALDGKPYITSTSLIAYYPGILHKELAVATSTVQKITADATYYGNTWYQTSLVHGDFLHGQGFDGSGKLIAVLDAGFQSVDTHPGFDSLFMNGRVYDTHNFKLAAPGVYAYSAHGTGVLSTIAGFVPGTFVGTAPRAMYALYVSEDSQSEQPIEMYNMLAASERADSIGADIITSSLGYNTFDDFHSADLVYATDLDGKSTIAARAANMATRKGMLFVASAGNEGGNSWNHILTPGDADSALTVGSVDNTGTAWFTSGYGPNAAGQVKPDVCAYGHNASVFTTTGYGAEDGTSLSVPQIAGWAACLWQANPSATPYLIRQAIMKCASKYSSSDTHIGYGVPNFQCTQQVLSVADTPPPFSATNWIMATPNPFNGDLKLFISPAAAGNVYFSLTDMAGRLVATMQAYAYHGTNIPMIFSLPSISSGAYILKATCSSQQQVIRVQKL